VDREIIGDIFSWSRMQTYCIQLICNKLYEQFNEVGLKNLQHVYHEILDQEAVLFSGYSRLLTKMQWEVLKAVAKEEPLINPLSKHFIQRYQLGAASSVSTALKMLLKKELIIEEDGGRFLVHDVLLARWLQTL
jgi:hypothetical protein